MMVAVVVVVVVLGGLVGPGYTCKCQGQMPGWWLHFHFTQARDE